MEQNPQAAQIQTQRTESLLSLHPLQVAPFQIQNNQQLATKLRWKSAQLLTLLGRNKSEHYSVLYLRKKGSAGKNGKLRILHNPDNLMRAVQYRILTKLLEEVPIPDYIHAFEKNRSIPSMAALHTEKKVVISLDLENFFGSIKQFHLKQIFLHLGIGETPSTTLSELCTFESFVPQGALTSPKVSNIITALTFGPLIKEFCDQHNLTLSIYADDITISSNDPISDDTGTGLTINQVITFVSRTVRTYGFKLNSDKIKVMKSHERQYVCGAVVNKKVNMLRAERMKLRAIVHRCQMNGVEAEATRDGKSASEFAAKIMGRLNWFAQLNPGLGNTLKDKFKEVCADQIMCPTAEIESVKEVGSLDSLPTPSYSELTQAAQSIPMPWEG